MSQAAAVPLAPSPGTETRSASMSTEPFSPPTSPATHIPSSTPLGAPIRNWDLPPKPKPGRKPATDQPPTKRKAQNRAAQRAFRERRAAQVQDLEEQNKKAREVWEQQRVQAHDEFDQQRKEWQAHVERLKASAAEWERKAKLEEARRKERDDEVQMLTKQLEGLNMRPWTRNDSRDSWSVPPLNLLSSNDARPTDSRSQSALQPPEDNPAEFRPCSDCGKGGKCACIDAFIADASSKSTRHAHEKHDDEDPMEIDFTTRPSLKHSATSSDKPFGPTHCGFCTDDDNCICKIAPINTSSRIAALGSIPSLVSPPESTAGDMPSQRPPILEPTATASGPGSCPSCLNDPERANWCRNLAGLMPPPSSVRRPSSNDVPLSSPRSAPTSAAGSGVSPSASEHSDRYSCTDTYTILARDPNFERNKDSVSYLRQLKTYLPSTDAESRPGEVPGSSAYEVDAASVLTALRDGRSVKPGQ